MTSCLRRLPVLTFLMLTVIAGPAQVVLPKILSSHTVLQRERPIHIWGWAEPGEAITVSFYGNSTATVTDKLGRWSAYLPPEKAGGPYTLTVKGSTTVSLTDVLVGDVWFASGQSNMEMPLAGFPGQAVVNDADAEIRGASDPELRLLLVKHASSEYPLPDLDGGWEVCSPASAAHFSAVAYFFGRQIRKHEGVPVGLIDASWGGTPGEAWTSLDALSSDAGLMPAFAARAEMMDEEAEARLRAEQEKREDARAAESGRPATQHAWHPDPASWAPAGLFNGMVAPATPFAIRGVIWYQGETNSNNTRAALYGKLFPALIDDWRLKWHQGDFPFLFVQLANFTSTPQESWAIIREAQRRTLGVVDTAMTVTIDIGDPDNVHPANKQAVGERLALAARAKVYGEAIEYSGPLFRQATTEAGAMRLWFDHVGGGLKAGKGALTGFEVAAADGRFVPATARIEVGKADAEKAGAGRAGGETVVVSSAAVKDPVYARYAWSNAPAATLFNSLSLPASPFTTQEMVPSPCQQSCIP